MGVGLCPPLLPSFSLETKGRRRKARYGGMLGGNVDGGFLTLFFETDIFKFSKYKKNWGVVGTQEEEESRDNSLFPSFWK